MRSYLAAIGITYVQNCLKLYSNKYKIIQKQTMYINKKPRKIITTKYILNTSVKYL